MSVHQSRAFTPFGAVFIIAGTAVGAAMLGLPLAAAAFTTTMTTTLLFIAWAYSLVAGFIILKLCRHYQRHDLPQMAADVLGGWAKWAMQLSFTLLCSCLLATYSAAGGELFVSLSKSLGFHVPHQAMVGIFGGVLGVLIYKNLQASDHLNRLLFMAKILCLCGMAWLLYDVMGPRLFSLTILENTGHIRNPIGTLSTTFLSFMVFLASFGYHVVLPSICQHTPDKGLGKVLVISTLIPLGMYIFWDIMVKNAVFQDAGSYGLIMDAPQQLSALLMSLGAHHPFLWVLAQWFSLFAVTTSFIGVGVALYDGMKQLCLQIRWSFVFPHQQGHSGILPFALTFAVPLLIAIFVPQLFVKGLAGAGIASTIYAMIIPGLMGCKVLETGVWKTISLLSALGGCSIIAASLLG